MSFEVITTGAEDIATSFLARQTAIENYLADLDAGESIVASIMADDLMPGGLALANTVAIIPVAAHQEAAQIVPAMAQYAKQLTNKPFTVVLGLNSPSEKLHSNEVQATENEIEKARQLYPGLDIRSTFANYKEPVMGRIRRDLWNGVIEATKRGGNFEGREEVVGISHDIDLIHMHRGFIAAIQKQYEKVNGRQIVPVISPAYGTQAKHAYDPAHPNISKAVYWHDFFIRHSGNMFEAGMVLPLPYYAQYGGFRPENAIREVHSLVSVGQERRENSKLPKLLRGTSNATSPRRFVERIDSDEYHIWSEEKFSADDACRTAKDFPDITEERMTQIIQDSFGMNLNTLTISALEAGRKEFAESCTDHPERYRPFEKGLAAWADMSAAQLERMGRLVSIALRTMIGSEKLSGEAGRHFMPSEIEHHKRQITRGFCNTLKPLF